jgi:23S rRNA pseudouridine2605 synthase
MSERLQKALARAGIASRRKAEEMIRAGRVQINGVIVTEMGQQVEAQDRILVDGRPLQTPPAHLYIMLNKPRGVLSTARDEHGRQTVLDLVPHRERLFPVGRLDRESEGLILLTNDGELTQRLTHPRYEHEKEYRVLVRGTPSAEALRRLRAGLILEDGTVRADDVEVMQGGGTSLLRIVIHEGRKHLVRRMCEALGYPALRLIRVRMGPLELGPLAPGRHRALTVEEIGKLRL